MLKLLIIADDFTGALDTGVQFAMEGADTLVVTDPLFDFAGDVAGAEVVVLDAETRHLAPEEAAAVVGQVVGRARENAVGHLYKKTDSALRGNIGSELEAALSASGLGRLHFLPAFPSLGRTTEGGIHYINGKPVSESVFASDPFEPVTQSHVAEIIGATSKTIVHTHSTGDGVHTGEGIHVYDALTDDDLMKTGEALKDAGELTLTAGCAGFASFLPRLLSIGGGREKEIPTTPGLILLCGSVNPISVAQVAKAAANGFAHMRMGRREKLEEGFWNTPEGEAELASWMETIRRRGNAVIDTNGPNGNAGTDQWAFDKGLTIGDIRKRAASALGHVLSRIVSEDIPGTLMVTGGDTLMECMKAIGVKTVRPVKELRKGVVLSRIEIGGSERLVITKSGGFGDEDLLVDLAAELGK